METGTHAKISWNREAIQIRSDRGALTKASHQGAGVRTQGSFLLSLPSDGTLSLQATRSLVSFTQTDGYLGQ